MLATPAVAVDLWGQDAPADLSTALRRADTIRPVLDEADQLGLRRALDWIYRPLDPTEILRLRRAALDRAARRMAARLDRLGLPWTANYPDAVAALHAAGLPTVRRSVLGAAVRCRKQQAFTAHQQRRLTP